MAAKKNQVAPSAAKKAPAKATKRASKRTATRASERTPKKTVKVVDAAPGRHRSLKAVTAARQAGRKLVTRVTKARTSVQHAVEAVKNAAPKSFSATLDSLVAKARSLRA